MLATPEIILQSVQRERLKESLPKWLEGKSLYRAWPVAGISAEELMSPALWARLPLIAKADIRRDFPLNLAASAAEVEGWIERGEVEQEYTSGTSEERTPLLLPAGWWAEQEQRALVLNPHVREVLQTHPEARRITINSPMCSNDICYTGVPSRAERTVGTARFVSLSRLPFLWGERDLQRMAAEMVDWDPVFLDADPAYAVPLALYCERKNIRLPSLRFILGSYEFVSVNHKSVLERVFGVPVYNLYGSTETGHLLMENCAGWMKASPETAMLEVQESDARGIGNLIVSTLTNDYMPLIRYAIGDLVERREHALGTDYLVHGRVADSFLSGGRRVTVRDVDAQFAGLEGVAHYQFVQRPEGWLMSVIPDQSGLDGAQERELQERLEHLTESRVKVTRVDLLMPEKSGKFRLVYPAR